MRVKLCAILIILSSFCFTANLSASAPLQYRARTIGISGYANAINDSNQIVGNMDASDGKQHAFFWSESTGVIDLGLGKATDINSEGRVVGNTVGSAGNSVAFEWKPGGSINYIYNLEAYSINDSGIIAGTEYVIGEDGFLQKMPPVVLKPTGERIVVQAVRYGMCTVINNQGKVAGWYKDTNGNMQAFTWTEETGVNFLPTTPYKIRLIEDINDNGQMVGTYGSNSDTHACAWDSDKSPLYYLTNIGVGSDATAINNAGLTVGYYWQRRHSACLWNTDGSVITLHTPDEFANGAACDINNSGVVVGYQFDGDQSTVVVWEPVPEPSSILAILCGVSGLIYTRKRK